MPIKSDRRTFAGALIKKRNAHAKCTRIIQRSLHSVSVRRDARFKCKPFRDTITTAYCYSKSAASDVEFSDCPDEVLVPQQQWDEMFERAFEAISETCIEAFNEQ
jgi:hypothetical protein